MSKCTALTAVIVIAALASRTAAADPTPPVAVAHILIIRLAPEDKAAGLEDYTSTQGKIIQTSEIAKRAASSKRLQSVPAVAGADAAAIKGPLKVQRGANGIRDNSLTITASAVTPEGGVAILEAVLDGYQDYLQQTYKLPEPGQPFRVGYVVAVLAKPAPVKK